MSFKKWFRITLAMILPMVLPCILSAQNSGVAGDGTFRLMWRGTNSLVSLWSLDSSNNINVVTSHEYGPFYGWLPIALTTANNGNSYILWRNTNGSISLWLVDANLNFVGSHIYGPFDGWTAESLSVDTANTNRFRVLWRDTEGRISIWIVDPSLNMISSRIYGPFFGFDPTPGAVVPKSAQRSQSGGNQEADRNAAAAMKVAGSGAGTSMPEQ
jgi:hypothetical protein